MENIPRNLFTPLAEFIDKYPWFLENENLNHRIFLLFFTLESK
jgi:hypothetical protein